MKRESHSPANTYHKNYEGPKIKRWLSEDEMSDISPVPALNGGKALTIGVVALFLFKKDGKLFTILSTERDHDFDKTPKKKTKLPAAMMEINETWEETIHRRIVQETGLTPKKMKLCCVADMSSTEEDTEDHYKGCVVITEVEGNLNEESVDEVQNKKLIEVKFLRENVIYGQKILLDTFFAKVSHDPEYAFALMNI